MSLLFFTLVSFTDSSFCVKRVDHLCRLLFIGLASFDFTPRSSSPTASATTDNIFYIPSDAGFISLGLESSPIFSPRSGSGLGLDLPRLAQALRSSDTFISHSFLELFTPGSSIRRAVLGEVFNLSTKVSRSPYASVNLKLLT